MTTTAPNRVATPRTGGEREQFEAFLDYQRATVAWKCSGLTDEQARRRHVPSELTTIAGLLGHLVLVENYWFSVVVDGQEDVWEERLKEDPDAEFRDAETKTMAELLTAYETECARSRAIVAKLELDHVVECDGKEVNVRWVLNHMIEETARHAGHLDLLRELTDGFTGQ